MDSLPLVIGVALLAIVWQGGASLGLVGMFCQFLICVAAMIGTKGIYRVQSNEAIVMEKWGVYHATLRSGIYWFMPFMYQPKCAQWSCATEGGHSGSGRFSGHRFDLRVQTLDFLPQTVLTVYQFYQSLSNFLVTLISNISLSSFR